jgi:predicted small secreted protein
MLSRLRPLAALLMVLGMSLAVAACGDTWRGLREDTSENLDKASDAARP